MSLYPSEDFPPETFSCLLTHDWSSHPSSVSSFKSFASVLFFNLISSLDLRRNSRRFLIRAAPPQPKSTLFLSKQEKLQAQETGEGSEIQVTREEALFFDVFCSRNNIHPEKRELTFLSLFILSVLIFSLFLPSSLLPALTAFLLWYLHLCSSLPSEEVCFFILKNSSVSFFQETKKICNH